MKFIQSFFIINHFIANLYICAHKISLLPEGTLVHGAAQICSVHLFTMFMWKYIQKKIHYFLTIYSLYTLLGYIIGKTLL